MKKYKVRPGADAPLRRHGTGGKDIIGSALSMFMLRLRRSKALPMTLLALAALVIICWMAIAVSNNTVSVNSITVSVPGLPSVFEGYTLLHMSDLNGKRFDANQSKLIKTVNGLSYNIIVMTGDMIGSGGDPEPLYELIDGLTAADRPIIFIPGDCDPPVFRDEADASGNLFSDYILGLLSRGVAYLDAPIALVSGNSSIWFSTGAHINLDVKANLDDCQAVYNSRSASTDPAVVAALPYDAYNLAVANQIYTAYRHMAKGDVHVTLSHAPLSDAFITSSQNYSETSNHLPSPNIALAGHYVAGQWRVPFYGALYVPDERLPNGGWFPNQSYVMGMRQFGSTTMYTSAGLATSSVYKLPAFRLFTLPQLTLIRLTSKLDDVSSTT